MLYYQLHLKRVRSVGETTGAKLHQRASAFESEGFHSLIFALNWKQAAGKDISVLGRCKTVGLGCFLCYIGTVVPYTIYEIVHPHKSTVFICC